MNITTLNTTTLKALRKEMQKALEAAGVEGVEFHVGNCSYGEAEATFKVSVKTQEFEKAKQDELKMYMKMYDLKKMSGAGFTLVRFDTKKRKYPFIAKDSKGSQYKLSVDQAKAYFG